MIFIFFFSTLSFVSERHHFIYCGLAAPLALTSTLTATVLTSSWFKRLTMMTKKQNGKNIKTQQSQPANKVLSSSVNCSANFLELWCHILFTSYSWLPNEHNVHHPAVIKPWTFVSSAESHWKSDKGHGSIITVKEFPCGDGETARAEHCVTLWPKLLTAAHEVGGKWWDYLQSAPGFHFW